MTTKTIDYSMFVLGAAFGASLAWYFTKKKYEEILQDDKVVLTPKEDFSEKQETKIAEVGIKTKPDLAEYSSMLRRYNRVDYSDVGKEEDKPAPYVISPDEFGGVEEYEKISLSYYADGILADDDDEVMENADEIVGLDSLTHFGEYEDDSVFVRNDVMKCDYEILLDHRNYKDVVTHVQSLDTEEQ